MSPAFSAWCTATPALPRLSSRERLVETCLSVVERFFAHYLSPFQYFMAAVALWSVYIHLAAGRALELLVAMLAAYCLSVHMSPLLGGPVSSALQSSLVWVPVGSLFVEYLFAGRH